MANIYELKARRDKLENKTTMLFFNNFEIFDEKKVDKLWNFFDFTRNIATLKDNDINLINCQINNYLLMIKIIKSKTKVNKNYYDSIKFEIKQIQNKYYENIEYFNKLYTQKENENIISKFDINNETLYENCIFLKRTIMYKLEEKELIEKVKSEFKLLIPFLNYDEYIMINKKINRLLKHNDYDIEYYMNYFGDVKRLKINRLKKANAEEIIIKSKEILDNVVTNNNYEKNNHYENIMKSNNYNKELVLFINKYTHNIINNNKK